MSQDVSTEAPASGGEQREVVRTHFDDAGNTWGNRYDSEPRKMSDLDLQLRRENVHRLLGPLLASRATPATVLDLGCGGGNILEGLPDDKLCAVGMDLASEMVFDAATRRPGDAFMVGDAARIPLRDASVDVVTCIGVLEYVPQPQVVLKQIQRILAPGGHLIISFPNRTSLFRQMSKAQIALERVMIRALNKCRGRSNEGLAPKYRHKQWSTRQVCRMLEDAGLSVSDLLFNTFGMTGRFGCGRTAINLSRYLTERLRDTRWVSSSLAQTFVARACKPQ